MLGRLPRNEAAAHFLLDKQPVFVMITTMQKFKRLYLPAVLFGAMFFLYGASNVQLRDVETAIIQEDYATAGNLAGQFIDSKPTKRDLDEALYYLGLSQLRLANYEDAKKTFNLLLSGFPKASLRDKAYLGYFDSLYMDGKYPGALTVIEELLAKNPKSEFLSLVYLKAARANLKLTQWQPAKNYLKKIISEFPSSLEAHTAKQLLEEKQYFAVQVGAFLDQSRAEKLAEDLKSRGEYAYIVETIDREGKKFYRVRVGQLSLLDDAQKLESKLTRLGYPTKIYP